MYGWLIQLISNSFWWKKVFIWWNLIYWSFSFSISPFKKNLAYHKTIKIFGFFPKVYDFSFYVYVYYPSSDDFCVCWWRHQGSLSFYMDINFSDSIYSLLYLGRVPFPTGLLWHLYQNSNDYINVCSLLCSLFLVHWFVSSPLPWLLWFHRILKSGSLSPQIYIFFLKDCLEQPMFFFLWFLYTFQGQLSILNKKS